MWFASKPKLTPSEAAATPRQDLFGEKAIDYLTTLLSRVPDPDLTLKKANITRDKLRAMMTDDEIAQAFETRLDALVSINWRLETLPGGEAATTDATYDAMGPFVQPIIETAWQAVPYGYSVQEAVWKRGELITLDRIVEKPFEWFAPQRDGTLRYFPLDGRAGPEGVLVDTAYKFFLTIRKFSYMNPYGEALLSRLYWLWYFRYNAWRFRMQFLERFGTPLIVGKSSNTAKMAEALYEAVQDAVIVVPPMDEVSVISPNNVGTAFETIENSLVRQMQKLILGQTLTSGTDAGSGNRALGEVHNAVRLDKRNSDANMAAPTVQRVVDAFVQLNWPGAVSPKFIIETNSGINKDRALRDATLAKAGLIKFTEQYFLNRYDYEDGDFTIPEDAPITDEKPLDRTKEDPESVDVVPSAQE